MIVLLISVSVIIAVQANATQVSHTLGSGFTLTDDAVNTSAIVRNYSPISVPYLDPSYSYGARVIEGNAACDLNVTEGVSPCGSRTVWLGVIKQGDYKTGMLTIHPNHGNFTIELSAQMMVFFYQFNVAQTHVYCWTNDGERYSCRGGTQGLPGEPAGYFGLWLIILLVTVEAVVIALSIMIVTRPRRVLRLGYNRESY